MAKIKYRPPKGYHALTPYLAVDHCAEAIAFYIAAFGAKELYRLHMGDKIGHAELEIGDSRIMLSDEFPAHGATPKALGGSPVSFTLYVKDVDAAIARAVDAGATIERQAENHFYGDRSGRVVDPFGHRWSIQQRLEDVSPKQMQKRLDRLVASAGPASESEMAADDAPSPRQPAPRKTARKKPARKKAAVKAD